MSDPLQPNPALLAKIGSILVHAAEGASDDGHHFDYVALNALLADGDVKRWLAAMDKLALIPKRRNGPKHEGSQK